MKEYVATNLKKAHNITRDHLRSLMRDVTEEIWPKTPQNSIWSMQSTTVEILNYEVKLLNYKVDHKYDYIPDNLLLDKFENELSRVSHLLISHLLEEHEQAGFVWKNDHDGPPSYHWIMVRTIQHSIYHCGGLSVLRSIFNLPRANYRKWPKMVDAVFEAGLKKKNYR